MRSFIGCVTAVAAVALAGCGGTTIDGDRLEGEIASDAEAAGLVLDDADCPSPDAEADASFECTVTVKGEERQLEVVQRDDDGNVSYDLGPLLEGTAGGDAGGDEAAIRSVIEEVNGDVTALCAHATEDYREELARETGHSCVERALEREFEPIEDYEVSVEGDTAAVAGRDSDDDRTVAFERDDDGAWLITRFE